MVKRSLISLHDAFASERNTAVSLVVSLTLAALCLFELIVKHH